MDPFILLSGLQLRRLSDSHERSVNPLMFPDLLRRRRLSKQPMRKQTKSSSSSQAPAVLRQKMSPRPQSASGDSIKRRRVLSF